MNVYKYTMTSIRVWDGKPGITIWSNNLAAFDKYKNKENYRITIKKGKVVIYKED